MLDSLGHDLRRDLRVLVGDNIFSKDMRKDTKERLWGLPEAANRTEGPEFLAGHLLFFV